MLTNNTNLKQSVISMSYTDFVGFVNQWNVLPGSYNTLSKWGVFSKVNSESKILELACTSGFSSRELVGLFGGSALGLDISESSVEAAKYNKNEYANNLNLEYICTDGESFENQEKYSHVIVGASLKFFNNPEKVVEKIAKNFLQDGGFLLASPFYTISDIPQELIEEAKQVFGITITTTNYKETMRLYRDFEIVYEERNNIVKESDEELAHYCKSTVDRACKIREITDPEVIKAMYDRLLKIKEMSNKLRPYQNYSVLVLRYRSNIYPNRYTELF